MQIFKILLRNIRQFACFIRVFFYTVLLHQYLQIFNAQFMPEVIAIMSGKGGVGKSTISSLAACIFSENKKTLLLDFDLSGPSIKSIFKTTQKVLKRKKAYIQL